MTTPTKFKVRYALVNGRPQQEIVQWQLVDPTDPRGQVLDVELFPNDKYVFTSINNPFFSTTGLISPAVTSNVGTNPDGTKVQEITDPGGVVQNAALQNPTSLPLKAGVTLITEAQYIAEIAKPENLS